MKKNNMIILISVLFSLVFSQVKIGNIEIPDSIASEYLLDCYKNPDTVIIIDCLDTNFSIPKTIRCKTLKLCNLYQNNFMVASRSFYYESYYTFLNGDWVQVDPYKDWESVTHIHFEMRYLINRKATEDDFNKWLSKR